MTPIKDEELIKRLRQKQGQEQQPAVIASVEDPELLERLKKKRAEAVAKTPVKVPDENSQKESSVPQGSVIGDFFRSVGSVASSAIAEPLSGIAGITTLLGTAGDTARTAESVESMREFLTYRPETQGAIENLESFGELVAPVANALERVSEASGDAAYEWTGSPELAMAFYSLPTAALELAGFKGIRGVKRLSEADLRAAQKAALRDPELKYDPSVATVKLNKKGQLVEDVLGKKLIENGVREGDAAVITNSTPSTKKRMAQMVDLFEKSKGNTIDSMVFKTTQPIGESVTNRLQVVSGRRKALGKALNDVVDGPLGQTEIDITPSFAPVTEILKSEGIKPRVTPNGYALPKDWQKETAFDLKSMSAAKTAIEDVFKLIDMKAPTGKTTLQQAHKIKKNLDEMINPKVLQEAGVSPQVIRKVTEMRKLLNESLGAVDDYKNINSQLGQAIEAMSPFEKMLKPGQTWSDTKVSAVAGEALKRLTKDSAYSAGMIQDLSALESYMRSAGIALPDDPRALIRLRETLIENFNSDPKIPPSQMAGATGSLMASAAVGNTFGAVHDASKLVRAGISGRKAKKIAADHVRTFNTIKAAVNQP